MTRTDGISALWTLAVFVAGFGAGAIVNGILHQRELSELRQKIVELSSIAGRLAPRRTLTVVVDDRHEAAKHAAAADRRANH